MCECCEQPKKCEKGKDPKECPPEQIKECHGDSAEHPCATSEGKDTK
jgi:hypothetical protein